MGADDSLLEHGITIILDVKKPSFCLSSEYLLATQTKLDIANREPFTYQSLGRVSKLGI